MAATVDQLLGVLETCISTVHAVESHDDGEDGCSEGLDVELADPMRHWLRLAWQISGTCASLLESDYAAAVKNVRHVTLTGVRLRSIVTSAAKIGQRALQELRSEEGPVSFKSRVLLSGQTG